MQLSNVKMKLQCDQMATLFVQYLGIYNNVNSPKSINKLPDKAQKFAKYHLNPPEWLKKIIFFQSIKILPNLVTLIERSKGPNSAV